MVSVSLSGSKSRRFGFGLPLRPLALLRADTVFGLRVVGWPELVRSAHGWVSSAMLSFVLLRLELRDWGVLLPRGSCLFFSVVYAFGGLKERSVALSTAA